MNETIVVENIVNLSDNTTNELLLNISNSLGSLVNTNNLIDPSWFYSAAAQSVAALTGIIIAFMITYIFTISSRKKQLKDHIVQYENEKKATLEEIKPFEDWIKEEDMEEDVKDFLKDQKKVIDPDNPPSVDKLYEISKKSEDDILLDKEILKKHYNEEYLKSVKDYKNNSSFIGLEPIDYFPNSNIISENVKRYHRYMDLLVKGKAKISYFDRLIEEKTSEYDSLLDFKRIKLNFIGVLVLASALVFFPLAMLLNNYDFMDRWKVFSFAIILIGWISLSFILYSIVKKQF